MGFFSWRRAEYTVWNVKTKLSLFQANTLPNETRKFTFDYSLFLYKSVELSVNVHFWMAMEKSGWTERRKTGLCWSNFSLKISLLKENSNFPLVRGTLFCNFAKGTPAKAQDTMDFNGMKRSILSKASCSRTQVPWPGPEPTLLWLNHQNMNSMLLTTRPWHPTLCLIREDGLQVEKMRKINKPENSPPQDQSW